MLSYLYDFLSILFGNLKEKEKIRSIILFGSFARGDYGRESDIDLFIDVKENNKEAIDDVIKKSLIEFETKSEKSRKIKRIAHPIIPIIDDLNNSKWEELRMEMGIYGISVYGRFRTETKKEKRFVLIEYELNRLKQKDKMRLIRKLLGYKLKKGNKIYTQKGKVEECNAEKISNGILVEIERYKEISDILRKNKIPIKIREI